MNRESFSFVDPSDLSPEAFIPLLSNVRSRFRKIFGGMRIYTPSGKQVKIEIKFQKSDLKNLSGNVDRISKDPAVYRITYNTALLYHLLVASQRIIDSHHNKLLIYSGECNFNNREVEVLRAKTLKAALWLSIDFVILHEFSHVFLGHIDYSYDEEQFTSDEISIRKVFEADADRHAGKLLIAFFDLSLNTSNLQSDLLFSSRLSAYGFYTYLITSMFGVFQDLDKQGDDTHPRSNERMYIVIDRLLRYCKEHYPLEHDSICFHVLASTLLASKEFAVTDAIDFSKMVEHINNLKFFDEMIENTKIRRYEHKIEMR